MQYALVKMILKRALVEADSFLEEFLLCVPTDYGGGGEMELHMLFSRNTHSSTSSQSAGQRLRWAASLIEKKDLKLTS